MQTEDAGVAVIIPTRDRPDALEETLRELLNRADLRLLLEVVVVDDGSTAPVVPPNQGFTDLRVLRLPGVGRSAARNSGARAAHSPILLFVDDDMTVTAGLIAAHFRAQVEWPGAVVVGAIRLPESALSTPFGRFRQRLEDTGIPRSRGISKSPNLCAAANMSITRDRFLAFGGFDESLASGEDQDLALRHTAAGGSIVFLPEAEAKHRDTALDIRSYCRRVETGAEHDVAFVLKQPDWPENKHRQRINGPLAIGREPVGISLGKVAKAVLGYGPFEEALFSMAELLERAAPNSAALDRLYRILLGIHVRRGYLRGLRALPGG